jgi:hypothetical protein
MQLIPIVIFERIATSMAHASSFENPSTASGAAPFSPAEWEVLRAEDKQAAKHIVWLMQGIFIMGLIGYSIICLIVK